jgi:predicted ATPase
MDDNNAQKAHLSKIQLSGYKSIKELDLEMLPINILIGANGAGKSNFISLFSLLRALSQGRFKDHVKENGGANSLLHFGAKNTSKIIVDIDVSVNGYHVELRHDLFEDELIFEKEFCRFNDYDYSKPYYIKGKNGESGLFEGGAVSQSVRDYTRFYLEKCQVYHFHDTGRTAGFKQSSPIDATDYLYTDAKNIAAFLYRLKNDSYESYRNIVDAVRTVAPFFHDFYLEPRGEGDKQSILLKWTHRKSDEPFSAQQLSDGTARFIAMATLFLQPPDTRPKTIILDEPELGLHPFALEVLADIIKSVSKTDQVICSTQSAAFANHFEPENFIVVDQSEGVSTFSRPDKAEFLAWLEDYKMGDIWNKNLIGGRPAW